MTQLISEDLFEHIDLIFIQNLDFISLILLYDWIQNIYSQTIEFSFLKIIQNL